MSPQYLCHPCALPFPPCFCSSTFTSVSRQTRMRPAGDALDFGTNYGNAGSQRYAGRSSARHQMSSFLAVELGTMGFQFGNCPRIRVFTLRWKFYRTAPIICNAPHYDSVRKVVNPSKGQKLEEVASRHQIDPVEFKRVGRQLRQVWPLLP